MACCDVYANPGSHAANTSYGIVVAVSPALRKTNLDAGNCHGGGFRQGTRSQLISTPGSTPTACRPVSSRISGTP